MPNFVSISKDQFDRAMQQYKDKTGHDFFILVGDKTKRLLEDAYWEIVYVLPLGDPTPVEGKQLPAEYIKVYTSIPARSGRVRPVGKDAIRITAYYNKRWHGQKQRVNRTENWQARVAERLDAFFEDWQKTTSYKPNNNPQVSTTNMLIGNELEARIAIIEPEAKYDVLAGTDIYQQVAASLYGSSGCVYCGNMDAEEVDGIGLVCNWHFRYYKGQGVLSFFGVI